MKGVKLKRHTVEYAFLIQLDADYTFFRLSKSITTGAAMQIEE
jgi:hypothetical protein